MKPFPCTHPSKHHRKPKSKGGNSSRRNIAIVNRKHHTAYHILFGVDSPQEVCDQLNTTWIDPDYTLLCVPTERAVKAQKLIDQLT